MSTSVLPINNSFLESYNTTTVNSNVSLVNSEYKILLPTVWSLLIIIGTFGNGLVIYTLGKNGEITATNCYVVNLAVADLTFLIIVVPFTTAHFALPDWRFGEGVCKTSMYMIYGFTSDQHLRSFTDEKSYERRNQVTLHATCLTLTAMTVDRYHAIVHPVSSMNWRSKRASTIVSIAVWAISFIISIPFAMYNKIMMEDISDMKYNKVYCKEEWPSESIGKGALVGVIISTYVFPLTVIVICYYKILKNIWSGRKNRQSFRQDEDCNGPRPLSNESQLRRRKRVTRMVAIVVLLFATFWFPIHVFNLCWKFIKGFPNTSTLYNIKIMAHTLSYANSCVNPFVYAFLNDGFKKAFSKSFPCLSSWCPCMKMISDERYTQVTGMVDQAIQAMPGEDNDVIGDVTNNGGGAEIIHMKRVMCAVPPERV